MSGNLRISSGMKCASLIHAKERLGHCSTASQSESVTVTAPEGRVGRFPGFASSELNATGEDPMTDGANVAMLMV